MADTTRYTKTELGAAEIRLAPEESARPGAHDADPDRPVEDGRRASRERRPDRRGAGLPPNARARRLYRRRRGTESAPAESASRMVTKDELARFRAAKAFINETVVDALGVRAFMFTLKLERCSTLADLAELLPDYAKAIAKGRGEAETRLLVDRAAELLA